MPIHEKRIFRLRRVNVCALGEHSPCKLKRTFAYLFTQVSKHVKIRIQVGKSSSLHSFLLLSTVGQFKLHHLCLYICKIFPDKFPSAFHPSDFLRLQCGLSRGEGGGVVLPPQRCLACTSLFLHLFCHFSDTSNTHLYSTHALDMSFFTSLKPAMGHSYRRSGI